MKTEKLELKHLAPYLPYDVGYIVNSSKHQIQYKLTAKTLYHSIKVVGFYDIKPILRPLSDLVKEIEHNGEKFIPLGKLHYKYCLTASGERTTKASYEYHIDRNCYATYYGLNGGSFGIYINTLEIDRTSYRILNWLFKWHFDVFGLIDKGLAIDINTLEDETNG